MQITGLDHLVLTVRDPEQVARFYHDVLGMKIHRQDGRVAVHYRGGKINLHPHGREYTPHARQPIPGSADFCLLTEHPLARVMQHLQAAGVTIEEGPVERNGAVGPMRSLYFRDPEGNLVEVATPLEFSRQASHAA